MHPILRFRRPLLALVAAGSAWLGLEAARLRISTDNELMHSTDNPVREAYERFVRTFGPDRSLVIAVEAEDVLARPCLARIDALSKSLSALPGVLKVRGLATDAVPAPAGLLVIPRKVAGEAPDFLPPDRILETLRAHPWLGGRLRSADGCATSLGVELDAGADPVEVRRVAMAADAPGFRVLVAGLSLAEHDIADAIRRDQELIVPLIFGAFALLLALLMRSVRGVALPLLVVGLTLAWTLGIYVLRGHPLNTVTALLSPVVMILSIEIAVHLVKAHEEQCAAGLGPAGAADRILRDLLGPCFMTALTTVIGFLSLLFTPIPAIRLFAAYASLGVLVSFGVSMVVVPAALAALPPPRGAPVRPWAPSPGFLRRPSLVLAASLGIVGAALAGLPRLEVDTNLLRILRASAPVVQAAEFVDRRLTGAHSLEVMLRRADGAPLDRPEDWTRVRDLSAFLLSGRRVTHVFSPLDVLGSISAARRVNDPLAPDALRTGLALFQSAGREAAAYLSPDRTAVRLTARLGSAGSRALADLVHAIHSEAAKHPAWIVEATGLFALTAFDSNDLVANQLKSLGLALLLVLTFIGLQFRSAAIGALAAVPNLLPIAVVYGVMAWTGIGLSTATAMISSVMLGLIVDSTILFTARWRRERSVEGALRGTASPIAASALILSAGFAAGGLGSFPPTLHFSFLSALTLALSAVSALVVLPACLSFLKPGAAR